MRVILLFVRRVRKKLLQQIISRVLVHSPKEELVRLGSEYGGWWVPLRLASPGTFAISAGVGEDTSFDEELLSRGCEVWALDPTPRAIEHIRRRLPAADFGDRFHFLPVGLWHRAERLRFYAPANQSHVSHSVVNIQNTTSWFLAECISISDLMTRTGRDTFDLLKLDIEGAEVEVLHHLACTDIRPGAICVEFDSPLPETRTMALLRELREIGYRLSHTDGWNMLFLYTR